LAIAEEQTRTFYDVEVSPDGKTVYFSDGGLGRCGSIFAVAITGGPAREIVRGGYAPAVSPDGKQLTYNASHSCGDLRHRMVVRDLTTGSEREWIGTWEGGYGNPVWAPDPRFLIVARAGADAARYFLLDTRRPGSLDGKSWPAIDQDPVAGIVLQSPGVTLINATVRPGTGAVAFGVAYSDESVGETHPILEYNTDDRTFRVLVRDGAVPLDFGPTGHSLIYWRLGGPKLKLFRLTNRRSFFLGEGFHDASW
ncbi:MAG: TolB family protein, partial [Actinomycetota bacterium]